VGDAPDAARARDAHHCRRTRDTADDRGRAQRAVRLLPRRRFAPRAGAGRARVPPCARPFALGSPGRRVTETPSGRGVSGRTCYAFRLVRRFRAPRIRSSGRSVPSAGPARSRAANTRTTSTGPPVSLSALGSVVRRITRAHDRPTRPPRT
jgi:hypothetical protein